jgi:hypothetical protein
MCFICVVPALSVLNKLQMHSLPIKYCWVIWWKMMFQIEDVNWHIFVNCQVNILACPLFMHELSVTTLFQSIFQRNVYIEVDYCKFKGPIVAFKTWPLLTPVSGENAIWCSQREPFVAHHQTRT